MEVAVRDSSKMEIGISYRNANMYDGAKDKGKTAIHDCKIPRKGNMQDKRMADSDSDSDSDSEVINLHLDCSDGVTIDAEPFKRESGVVQCRYECDFGIPKIESNSKTLEMVKKFCEGRAKIQDDYANYPEIFVQNMLNEFNSNFRQDYRSYAIELITAAFDLEIESLIFLMMEDVDYLFTQMTTDKEVEVYNFFRVNLKEYRDDKFEFMKDDLLNFRWAFEENCKINNVYILDKSKDDVRANNYWDSELLKLKFHEYKLLKSYEQRRQWLTAHFLLRRPCSAYFYGVFFKESADVDEKLVFPNVILFDLKK